MSLWKILPMGNISTMSAFAFSTPQNLWRGVTPAGVQLVVVVQATGSKVERVVITRLENHTYYSRIVLLLPGGMKSSVDSRPSDSLALALQCEAPLFVARQLARYNA